MISVLISCECSSYPRHMREWIQGLDKYEHYCKSLCHLRRNKAYMIKCWEYVSTYVCVKLIYLPNNGHFLQTCVFQVSVSTKTLAPAICCYKSLLLLWILIGLLACGWFYKEAEKNVLFLPDLDCKANPEFFLCKNIVTVYFHVFSNEKTHLYSLFFIHLFIFDSDKVCWKHMRFGNMLEQTNQSVNLSLTNINNSYKIQGAFL